MINLNINTQKNIYNIKCKKGSTLKDVLKIENIDFIFPCGANGRCGNCKIKILKGLDKPTNLDKMKLSKLEINEGIRLACCLYLKTDMDIFLNEIEEYNFLD